MTDTATTITVQYERKFSDGNYGSEGLSLSWTVTYTDNDELAIDEDIANARCAHITTILRNAVLEQLAKSEAERVAWAANRELNPPAPRQPQPVAAGAASDMEDMPF